MFKDDANLDPSVVQPKKRGNLATLRPQPFTPETAKAAAARSAYCRAVRAEMRKRLLEAAVDAGIDKIYAKALKSGDIDAMTVAREGMKLVGLDFQSSEEAVQRVDVKADAKVNAKTDTTLNITFKDANNS